jgi:hypothetical protein
VRGQDAHAKRHRDSPSNISICSLRFRVTFWASPACRRTAQPTAGMPGAQSCESVMTACAGKARPEGVRPRGDAFVRRGVGTFHCLPTPTRTLILVFALLIHGNVPQGQIEMPQPRVLDWPMFGSTPVRFPRAYAVERPIPRHSRASLHTGS